MPLDATRLLERLREAAGRVRRATPARLAVGAFLTVVAITTLLLVMPWATRSGRPANIVDALFTA
ncbi:MAG: TrkH family potassium uptake protein, partial [Bifidobacteriaceae bacterium]|nr:TrkH family potassium uptake protein [Bifidobacteriaceae bacterium]